MKKTLLLSILAFSIIVSGCSTMPAGFQEEVPPPAKVIVACDYKEYTKYEFTADPRQEAESFKLMYASLEKQMERCKQAAIDATSKKAKAPEFKLHWIHFERNR